MVWTDFICSSCCYFFLSSFLSIFFLSLFSLSLFYFMLCILSIHGFCWSFLSMLNGLSAFIRFHFTVFISQFDCLRIFFFFVLLLAAASSIYSWINWAHTIYKMFVNVKNKEESTTVHIVYRCFVWLFTFSF